MNAKQRRKQRRYLMRHTTFLYTESPQGNVHEFMNDWITTIGQNPIPVLKPLDVDVDLKDLTPEKVRDLINQGKLYPTTILNTDGTPLESVSPIIELNASFDYKLHEQSATKKELAKSEVPTDVQSGSVGTASSDTGTIPDH